MTRFARVAALVTLITSASLHGEAATEQHAIDALRRAADYLQACSVQGGYVGQWSADMLIRYGESPREWTLPGRIWVQPPGTPTVGEMYLEAWRATDDDRYLALARAAGRALAWGQRRHGGWDHVVYVGHHRGDDARPERKGGRGTFDDNISQGAVTFLMKLDDVIDEPWLDESITLALDYILQAQFDNGAWPQWYPLRGGYHDYYTFNDSAINDCIRVMREALARYGDERYDESSRQGAAFIIASQGPSTQACWAQQYSHDMKPAKARPFEPAAMCSSATTRNIQQLCTLYLEIDDVRLLAPIPDALDWLARSAIAKNRWARLYEVESNRPIYGDGNGAVHYELTEISEERRLGYAWQGDFGVAHVTRLYNDIVTMGRNAYRNATQPQPPTPQQSRDQAHQLEPRVQQVIAEQDELGRWLNGELYRIDLFVPNMRTLIRYIELCGGAAETD